MTQKAPASHCGRIHSRAASILSEHPLTASFSKEKTHINVVVIGHVDSGKSTTTGRKPTFTAPRSRVTSSHNNRFNLQVRWYRQAYDREIREGTFDLISPRSIEHLANFPLFGLSLRRGIFGGVWKFLALSPLRLSANQHHDAVLDNALSLPSAVANYYYSSAPC